MPYILVILILGLSVPADAGFRMFGPNGQFVNATETEAERLEREQREAVHRARAADAERIANHNRAMNEDQAKSLAPKQLPHQNPMPVAEDDGGAAPGGHRRKEFRDKYGFGTPASMYNAVRQERQALKRERQAAEKREANRRAQTVQKPPYF